MAGWLTVRPRRALTALRQTVLRLTVLRLTALAAATATSLSACGTVGAGAAATVGSTRIGTDELARRTDAVFELPGAKEQLARPDVQRRVLSELVGLQVDERLASRQGVTVAPAQVDQLVARGVASAGSPQRLQLRLLTGQQPVPAFAGADTYFRDALLLNGLLTRLAPTTVPEQALRDLYTQQEGQFRNAHLAHIVVADRAGAEQVLAKAKAAPDTFAMLARQLSTDAATKSTGGDEGTQPHGTYAAAVEDAVYAAQPGALLGPFPVQGGFDVVKVIAVTNRSFEQARTELAAAARAPQSPYTLGLLSRARADEARGLRIHTNPRFGILDVGNGSARGFPVTAAPDLLSTPSGGGSGAGGFGPAGQVPQGRRPGTSGAPASSPAPAGS